MKMTYEHGPKGEIILLNEKRHSIAIVMRCQQEEKIAQQLAASGDLLEAAERILTLLDGWGYTNSNPYYDLRTAIAKAKGK